MFLTHLMKQCKITRTRRGFDDALRALPLTQHDRIWKLYLNFAKSASGLTAIRVWKRYMQVQHELREDFIDLLHDLNAHSEAARQYIIILNDLEFKSRHGKSSYQLWSEFADLLVSHPQDIDHDIPVERILRAGIERFSDQRGKLWTSLAMYWITLQDFERARDAFEEGITTVMTVRDFTQIFDAYAEFEESIISEKMEAANRETVDVHLWVEFAKFYEEGGKLDTAREIMEKATRVGYRSVNELADVWIDYAEMEIRAGNMEKALEIMALATKAPRVSHVDYFDEVWTLRWMISNV